MAGACRPEGVDELSDAVRRLRLSVHGLGPAPVRVGVALGGNRHRRGHLRHAIALVRVVDAPPRLWPGGVVPARAHHRGRAARAA
ncbi:hypothetical protein G6F23_016028 [Rhizopus arrhizus]|nr:hypothetical protein G6F23_016028 [Rhizopus arrhizus]